MSARAFKKRKGGDGKESVRRAQRPGARRRILFLLPSLAGVSVFVLFPFFDVVRRSFFGSLNGKFMGFSNFQAVLSNKAFLLAAFNTLKFLAVCLPLLLTLSLLLALLLQKAAAWAGIFKTAFLLPMAAPAASVVLLWKTLFHQNGLVNGWMTALGFAPGDWMHGAGAFWVLVGSYLWKNIGYDMILWLAGLTAISPSLYEAAKVDGAGRWACFRCVTLPQLLPSLCAITVLSLLSAMKVFREAYLVAGEYPDNSIYLLQHLFNNWFRELSMDKLAAAAVLVALGTLAVLFFLRKGLTEE